jgi:hypothetical protein
MLKYKYVKESNLEEENKYPNKDIYFRERHETKLHAWSY